MGCKIESVLTDKGEQSQLYGDLLKSMDHSDALEYYLELKSNEAKYKELYGENKQGEVQAPSLAARAKFKLVEFDQHDHQTDTMEYLAEMLVNTFRSMPGVSSKSSISGLNLNAIAGDPMVLPTAVQSVKEALGEALIEMNFDSDQGRLTLNAIENIDRYLMEDGVLGKLGQKLQDMGVPFKISERRTKLEEQVENSYEQNQQDNAEQIAVEHQRIYDMEIIEASTLTTINDAVKNYIKGKSQVSKDYAYNDKGGLIYEKTAFNSNKLIEYEAAVGFLQTGLKDVQTPAEMIAKMEKIAQSAPMIAPIVYDIIEESRTNTSFTVEGTTYEYKPITAALFSTFAKHDYDMVSQIKDENGVIYFADANKSTTKNLIKVEWARTVQPAIQGMDAKVIAKERKNIEKFYKNDKLMANLNSDRSTSGTPVNMLTNYFNKVGYNIKSEDLYEAYEIYKTDPKFYDDRGRSFTSFTRSLVNTLVLNAYDSKGDIFKANERGFGEGKYLNVLAEANSLRKDDVTLGAYLSPRKVVLHPLNSAAEAHDFWKRLNTDQEFLQLLQSDPIYANTRLFKATQDPVHSSQFRVQTLDSSADNTSGKPAVTYGAMSSFDAVIMRINGYFDGVKNGAYFRAISPTQADRGNAALVTVPKINVDENGKALRLFNKEGEVVSKEVSEWAINQISAEATRIVTARNWKGDKVENYHSGNALKFNLFTELNDGRVNLEGTRSEIVAEATKHVLGQGVPSVLKEVIDSDIAFAMDESVLQETKNKGYSPTGDQARRGLVKNARTITTMEMQNFVFNNLAYTYEQLLMYSGDPAYYNQNTEEKPTAQVVDINKRMGLPFTPGQKMAVGPEYGITTSANVKIIIEPKFTSPLKSMFEALGITGRPFGNIEIADGQGYVSLSRYRDIMMSQGLHTDEMLSLIQELEKWKPGRKIKSKATLEVLKGFYFRLQEGPHGSVMPFNLKYSIVPAIPTLFEAVHESGPNKGEPMYPAMNKISVELRSKDDNSADEVVMQTAVKVGQSNITSIDNLTTAKATQIDNTSYRFPQPSPEKNKMIEPLGTQMRKMVEANMFDTTDLHMFGKEVKASEAIAGYQDALSRITDNAGTKVKNTFLNPEGEVNQPGLINAVLDNLEASNYSSIDYFREALTVIEGQTAMPLNYPTLKFKLDNIINGSFKKKTTRPEIPGYNAVQSSSMGMDATYGIKEVSVGSDLKFMQIAKVVNGKRVVITNPLEIEEAAREIRYATPGDGVSRKYTMEPAEIRVTPRYFLKRLKEIAGQQVNKKKLDEEMAEYREDISMSGESQAIIDRAVKVERAVRLEQLTERKFKKLENLIKDTNGKYDIRRVRKAGLDEMNLYRIPTGGKNYMLASKIKDFMDESFGSNVQVPAEIVDQAGSDFDIDKISLEAHNFNVEYNAAGVLGFKKHIPGMEGLSQADADKAEIVEFHKSVLTSTDYVAEVLNPNTVKRLADLSSLIGMDDAQLTANLGSMALQETFRANNQVGSTMISISSVASAAHAVSQKIGTFFDAPMTLNGVKAELGGIRTLDGGYLISSEIGLIQDAALDNAKDPLLGKLNISEFTSSVPLLAIQMGLGLEYAITLVNAPIIRDLNKNYTRFIKDSNREDAQALAVATVERKYRISLANTTADASTYDLAQAKSALAGGSASVAATQAKALKIFLAVKDQGDLLAEMQRALNFDSKGTPPSTSGLIRKYKDIARVSGTMAQLREKSDNPLLKKGVYGKPAKPLGMGVDPVRYKAHSMSTFEVNAIHKPFEVNTKISPTASLQIQSLISLGEEFLGRMSETQELQFIGGYDQYMLSDPNAVTVAKADITEYISSGKFIELSTKGDPSSASTLLQTYRTNQAKNGEKQNLFLANLDITDIKNRSYISFNNTTFRALTQNRKDQMLFEFEKLMNHGENTTEAKLAEVLTRYAITHYGFSTGINSFMAFIPPAAHEAYTKFTPEGTSTIEFYRQIQDEMNDRDNFSPTPENYVDQYVQNNAMRLGLNRLPADHDFDFSEWGRKPKYVLWKNADAAGYTLWKINKGGRTRIPLLGVQDYMVEYVNSAPSSVQDQTPQVNINPKAQKNLATPENTAIMNMFEQYDYIKSVLLSEQNIATIHDETQALKVMEVTTDKYGEFMDAKSKDLFTMYMKKAAKDTEFIADLHDISYNEAFLQSYDQVLENAVLSVSQPQRMNAILEKIQICNG